MSDNNDAKKHFDDFLLHEWYNEINLMAKKMSHRLPSGSKIQPEDLMESGIYGLHYAIKNWKKENNPSFVNFVKSTINGNMKQAIKNNQTVDPYFYDKFIAPHMKSQTKASEVKEISPEQHQQESLDAQPKVDNVEQPKIEETTSEKPKLP
jgi:DNA-directed RNA polymerase specialized sigma subunit